MLAEEEVRSRSLDSFPSSSPSPFCFQTQECSVTCFEGLHVVCVCALHPARSRTKSSPSSALLLDPALGDSVSRDMSLK